MIDRFLLIIKHQEALQVLIFEGTCFRITQMNAVIVYIQKESVIVDAVCLVHID